MQVVRAVLSLIAALSVTQPASPPAAQVAALHEELAALLAAADVQTDRLEDLATRSGTAAQAAQDPALQLQARMVQVRAYHALVRSAVADGRAGMASLRLVQLRSAAGAAKRSDAPGASLAGDYWLLMADLIDADRNARSLAEAQLGAIAQMERFCALYRDDPAAQQSPIVGAVKFMLMRLCDQAGENGRAMELLEALRDPTLAEAEQREPIFAAVAANAQLLGQTLDPSLRDAASDDGWRLLVIHGEAEQAAMQQAAQRIERDAAGMEPKLTVRLLPPKRAELDTGLPQGLGDALPRFVLVDEHQTIRAVGHTPAVAERLTALKGQAVAPSGATGASPNVQSDIESVE